MQVTYDKLETKNIFSKRFGQCRDEKIELYEDVKLCIDDDARNYQVLLPRAATHVMQYLHRCIWCLLADQTFRPLL